MSLHLLIIAASGGLGTNLVLEALARGHTVSVLVRNADKLPPDVRSKLSNVHIGSGDDINAVKNALTGVDVVVSGAPANPHIAKTLAEQTKASSARKLVWVAGASNMLEADGTLHHLSFGPGGQMYYDAHKPCIDAVAASGCKFVVFCPPLMGARGSKSSPLPSIAVRAHRGGSGFLSYEDAAWAMIEAAEVDEFDGQLITAYAEPVNRDL